VALTSALSVAEAFLKWCPEGLAQRPAARPDQRKEAGTEAEVSEGQNETSSSALEVDHAVLHSPYCPFRCCDRLVQVRHVGVGGDPQVVELVGPNSREGPRGGRASVTRGPLASVARGSWPACPSAPDPVQGPMGNYSGT
jgi:hypothetical protein